ncbi:MAG: hypothetical protein ABGY41_04575, partial [Candidatus Poribacteria bacterium]
MSSFRPFSGIASYLAWSPDASQIAVEIAGADGPGVYIVPVEGGEPRLILPDGSNPGWSPFFSEGPAPTLAFLAPDPGNTAVTGASEDASRIRVAMRNHEAGWNWRLDEPFPLAGPAGGHHVAGLEATVTGLHAGTTHTIYATLVDASGDVLTPTVLAVATVRVPAPDASGLDHTRITYRAGQAIYATDPGGLNLRKVADAASTGGVWSPDGASLAFVEEGDDGPALVVTDPDGEGRRVVFAVAGLRDPSWSPDGSGLLVATRTAILAVDVVSGKVTAVTKIARAYHEPRWSADGGTVAAIVDRSL